MLALLLEPLPPLPELAPAGEPEVLPSLPELAPVGAPELLPLPDGVPLLDALPLLDMPLLLLPLPLDPPASTGAGPSVCASEGAPSGAPLSRGVVKVQ